MTSNLKIEGIDLTALIDLIKSEVKREINCVSVGTIVSFDSDKQTANVSINYKKVLKKRNATGTKEFTDVIVEYPILLECPVVVLNGGGAYVSFPITAGDSCVVLFCDRDIDTWHEKGSAVNPPTSERLHDLSDAMALVGVNSLKDAIDDYESNKLKITYGGAVITIDSTGNIVIEGTTVAINGTTVSINS